ncbi:MAG: response regulator [Nitrospirae bacterium]|nr:response regulator [Nitrospirota bacterium]
MRILVIDDEPLVGVMLSNYLSNKGHNIVSVSSPKDALSAMNPAIFDVIITDYKMVPTNGIEAAKKIRATGYDGRIILMSACCDSTNSELAAAGIDVFLEKPFNLDKVSSLIEDLCGVKKKVEPEYAECVGF